jgi:cold shock CspA family protein
MHGTVSSFLEQKKFGFIDGEDGNTYFVHASDIRNRLTITRSQQVEFEPATSPKGLKARNVVPGAIPEKIYVSPDRFIMTRDGFVRGYDVVAVVSADCWGEGNDPNVARDELKAVAVRLGANAVVNLSLEKSTVSQGCSNYRYTMHHFSGTAVIVKRGDFSSDPDTIEMSKAQMDWIANLCRRDSVGTTKMVKPRPAIFYPKLVYFGGRTIVLILVLIPIALFCNAFSFRPRFLYREPDLLAIKV